MKYKTMVIGIDQSYQNTGISFCCDGVLKKVSSIHMEKLKCNSDKRKFLSSRLRSIISLNQGKANQTICVIERIRLTSQGFLNIDYIKSIGALNSIIVDVCSEYNIPVYSVDTRCWKASVVGTSKGMKNKYNVPPEKYPTVRWCINQGFLSSILTPIENRKSKNTFVGKDGKKYMFNNDASDSSAISMFYFKGDKNKLLLEK